MHLLTFRRKVGKPPRSMSRGGEGWPVAKSRALDRFQSRFVAITFFKTAFTSLTILLFSGDLLSPSPLKEHVAQNQSRHQRRRGRRCPPSSSQKEQIGITKAALRVQHR